MKRDREKHITRLHIILFCLFLTIALTLFLTIRHSLTSDKKYKDFEQVLKDGSVIYYKINKMDVNEDDEEIVDIKKLDEQGLLSDNSLMKKCKGYIIFSNEQNYNTDKYEINYKPYIDCGKKYSTINYSEALYIELTDAE